MDLLQPLAAVVLVLALLGAALFFLRSRGAASFHLPRVASTGARRMEVLERTVLSPQHTLHLVRIGEISVVIATSPSSSQIVFELGRDLRVTRL